MSPKAARALRDQIGDVGAVADVAADEADRATERRLRLDAGLFVDVGKHDVRPLFDEAARDGMADAARRAGNDRDLVLKQQRTPSSPDHSTRLSPVVGGR